MANRVEERSHAAWVGTIFVVAVAAAVVATLVYVNHATHQRIERNERAWLKERLDTLVPAALHDNDLLADYTTVIAPAVFGTAAPIGVYRARRAGVPTAAVLLPVAPDGYGGPIELMVAVSASGTLLGVQVIAHHETPGLGDYFEHSDWLERFRGRSLKTPSDAKWTVRKEGGEFDSFTGATVTPKAIIKAVHLTLEYYGSHREQLFAQPTVG
jgi:electron transport complex protein RnfG